MSILLQRAFIQSQLLTALATVCLPLTDVNVLSDVLCRPCQAGAQAFIQAPEPSQCQEQCCLFIAVVMRDFACIVRQ